MIQIVVIGSGNVAHHLISAFLQSTEIELVQVFARDRNALRQFSGSFAITNNLNELAQADLYLIAVSDDAIGPVSMQIQKENGLVAHTSGGVSIDGLASHHRRGVFYPLQTFSKNKTVDFRSIPICLEATTPGDYQLLEKVARSISDSVHAIDSNQRKALHVSAVFANNFTNHLYKIAGDICAENQIPFDILKPLIQETAQKILTLSPAEAQTGPARRHDATTIQRHLDFLTDNPKKIYQLLTQSIQNDQKL
ncbi:Rossmann-like and DUF2520 domain-containing protein [Flavobacterium sp.]|uniref:Rossmann-like and DUF2520 domain-containing protein n=1 Tax=Flavobacterium sp. TaxID=239 RepID=UPI0039E345E5